MTNKKPPRTMMDDARVDVIRSLLKWEKMLWLTPDPEKPSARPWWVRLGMTMHQRDKAIEALLEDDEEVLLSYATDGLRLHYGRKEFFKERDELIARIYGIPEDEQ